VTTPTTPPTPPTRRERLRAALVRRETVALAWVTIGLALGLGLLWVVKRLLGIESDAVFVALLVVPLLVQLAFTGQLSELQLFGATAKFKELAANVSTVQESVSSVKEKVIESGQREATRSAYLGKLDQVLAKNGREFCLLYADADGLRSVTRDRYLAQDPDPPLLHGTVSPPKRRSEETIRRDVIDRLELALTDGFYDTDPRLTKCDFFRLEEPDVVMIARTVSSDQAARIAAKATELFRRDGFEATITILAVANEAGDPPPEELDRRATERHRAAKASNRERASSDPAAIA
jgi:hypothetical protein